jgi:transposase
MKGKVMYDHLFVGVDTHKNSHTAAVLSGYFDTEATITFANSYQGFDKFAKKLNKIADDKSLLFGLEDSQGLGNSLAEFLIDKDFLVVDVNPVYTDRGRKHTIHRDKSDDRDAILIAKTLIRERGNLHPVTINKNSLALRELVRHRQILVEESTRLKNRLHVLLFNQYGHTCSIFSSLFSKVALAFFARYPNPSMLGSICPDSLADFLKANSKGRYSKKKAEAILSSLNNSIDNNLTDARAYIIKKHIERLLEITEELSQMKDMLSCIVEKSSYGSLTSIPGVDVITAAKIISSVVDIGRFSSSAKLAKFAGIAPREKSTGKKQKFQKSKHGKKYLRSTIYFMALAHISKTRNGRDKNPISRAYYLKKVAEGKTKKEAITCLCRRLIDLIFAVMRDRSIYNFSKSEFTKQHNVILNTIVA